MCLCVLLCREQVYVSDRSSIATLSSANAAGRLHTQHVCEDLSPHEAEENTVALHSGELQYTHIHTCILNLLLTPLPAHLGLISLPTM